MTGFWQLVVVFVLAVNPAAVAMAFRGAHSAPPRTATVGIVGAGVALALYVVATAPADAYLDFLDVEPETFRIAAGIVMAIYGAQAIWFGHQRVQPAEDSWTAGIYPLGLPLLAAPAVLIGGINFAADEDGGVLKTLAAMVVAGAVALGMALAARERARPWLDAVGRLSGAGLVVVATGLIVSGVLDV